MVKVLVPIADGTEDIELSCITDVLVRCGVTVEVCSVQLGDNQRPQMHVTLARRLQIVATSHINNLSDPEALSEEYDAVILPGGMPGAKTLGDCRKLGETLIAMKTKGKLIGAICAAPAVALAVNGCLNGAHFATCFPAMKDKLEETTKHTVKWKDEKVVYDHAARCITSQGPATAMIFALCCAGLLVSLEKAVEVRKALLLTEEDAKYLSQVCHASKPQAKVSRSEM